MADIQYYERVMKAQRTVKKLYPRLVMLALYALILGIWLIIAVRVGISASLLMLIPLSILTVSLLTWKYTSVEYEYSFTGGIFIFSKIYGKAKRKAIFEGDLKSIESVTLYKEHLLASLNADVINAVIEDSSQNPCMAVFVDSGKRTCVIFDCDEMSAKILRYFNPAAVDRDIFKRLKELSEGSQVQ